MESKLEKIIIKKFKKENTKEIALLIRNVFKEFNSNEYFKKSAIQRFLDHFDVKKRGIEEVYKTLSKSTIFYIALDSDKIVGIIRGGKERLVNLFISGKYHKRGIGKKLINKFEREAFKENFKEIKIRSSIYAIPFYQGMGYKKSTGIRNFMGLKVCPMKKTLKRSNNKAWYYFK